MLVVEEIATSLGDVVRDDATNGLAMDVKYYIAIKTDDG